MILYAIFVVLTFGNKEELEVLTSTTGWPLFLVKAKPPNAKIARETPTANTLKLVLSLHLEVETSAEPVSQTKLDLIIKKSSCGVWSTSQKSCLGRVKVTCGE